tara:strand:- start:136 stop:504 length:369 start_codon:yes stop_codon:yes gene_type:complete
MVKITFVIKNLLSTYYIFGFIAKGANKASHKVSYCGNNDDGYGVGVMLIIIGLIMFYKSLKKITAVIDKSKEGIFILSDKFEKELIDDYGGQSWIVPLGIILSGIGLSLILKSAGVFLSDFS